MSADWVGAREDAGGVKQAYKQNILQLLNRKNTKNDRLYKDDPTIMAWNLANEARCDDCDSWVLQSWIDEMAPFVKSHDDRHLIGVGHEGVCVCCVCVCVPPMIGKPPIHAECH